MISSFVLLALQMACSEYDGTMGTWKNHEIDRIQAQHRKVHKEVHGNAFSQLHSRMTTVGPRTTTLTLPCCLFEDFDVSFPRFVKVYTRRFMAQRRQ